MKTVLIIHGIMGHAGVHWQGWLVEQLERLGYKVLMPDMPKPKRPDRNEWLKTIKKLTEEVDLSNLTIVGHSLGVATALDYLETVDKKVYSLISVSGFAEDYGLKLNSYFLAEKNINFSKVKKKLENAYVLYGDTDPYVTQEALKNLATNLNVKPIVFKNGGHLNSETDYKKFPEILKIILTNSMEHIYKCGGILLKNKKLLVEKSPHRNFWVAPGGKPELNESPEAGLVRELKEEFGITVKEKDLEEFGMFSAKAAGNETKTVCMHVFIVNKWKGKPKPSAEVEDIKWISSKIPKGMKVGSIFEKEVIPRLNEKGLI